MDTNTIITILEIASAVAATIAVGISLKTFIDTCKMVKERKQKEGNT